MAERHLAAMLAPSNMPRWKNAQETCCSDWVKATMGAGYADRDGHYDAAIVTFEDVVTDSAR